MPGRKPWMQSLAFVPVLAALANPQADGNGRQAMKEPPVPRLHPHSTVGDILRHPSFAGFGHLILPWDGRTYDEKLPLKQIGTLLPFHTHVDAQTVASALNNLIEDAARGQKVFYRFYTDQQTAADPSKANAGLFFYRGKRGAPFAVISPGGGFQYVGSLHEGFPFAQEIRARGYHAFVLKYRAGLGERTATEDLAAALSWIFRHASELGLDTRGYLLWGCSAGARMAASIGSHGPGKFGGDDLPKPAAVVMTYTAHSDFSDREPPTFVVVGADDNISPPASMEKRVEALRKLGTPVEYRKYPGLGHGFGPGTGTVAEGWGADAIRFWEKHRGRPGDGRQK
ncbi:MAG: alpha/beta hydrolase [Bryobacteraceae bacterium]